MAAVQRIRDNAAGNMPSASGGGSQQPSVRQRHLCHDVIFLLLILTEYGFHINIERSVPASCGEKISRRCLTTSLTVHDANALRTAQTIRDSRSV